MYEPTPIVTACTRSPQAQARERILAWRMEVGVKSHPSLRSYKHLIALRRGKSPFLQ